MNIDMSKVVIICDTREQTPLQIQKYSEFKVIRDTLKFGDYTILNPDLRNDFIIERKNIDDFTLCCGRERDRFEKELIALRGYKYKYILCEFSFEDIFCKQYRSRIEPNAVMSSIAKWMTYGITFLMADNPVGASYIAAKVIEFTIKNELSKIKYLERFDKIEKSKKYTFVG